MVAQGYAVDYRRYSGGAYVGLMQKAARQRLGLWGQDYEGMRQLAVERPPRCVRRPNEGPWDLKMR